ncbi:MAG TPA: hypothetical protein ENK91_15470 [Bacteroidetes bacterium]|nr:hypothetical protein [Bacteroidota bacterium]
MITVKYRVFKALVICFILASIVMTGCITEDCQASYEDLNGEYMFYSGSDTSTRTITFFESPDGFETTGIHGDGFWFPQAPFSGKLENCKIIINEYNNVKRQGLSSPGEYKRYYYESLKGGGEFYPEGDSIVMFIEYIRTGDFPLEFKGNIHFIKI